MGNTFKPGLLHLIFQDEKENQFKGLNGYDTEGEAQVAADYYINGNFRFSGYKVTGVYLCQDIIPMPAI